MKTNRELIEFVLKAVKGLPGYESPIVYETEDGTPYIKLGKGRYLHPFTDNGDVLQLAVLFGISIFPPSSDVDDTAAASLPGMDGNWIHELVTNRDKEAATRLAVVTAVALIGERKVNNDF